MDWSVWGRDAAERAVKTGAQALLAALTVDGVSSVVDVGWGGALGAAGLAMVISVLTSVVSVGAADPSTASLVSDIRARRVA